MWRLYELDDDDDKTEVFDYDSDVVHAVYDKSACGENSQKFNPLEGHRSSHESVGVYLPNNIRRQTPTFGIIGKSSRDTLYLL